MTFPDYPHVPEGFLGLPRPFAEADVAVLPVPYEATVTYRGGTREGPAAIVEASRNLETWDEEMAMDLEELSICTLPALETDGRGPEAMVGRIEEAVGALMDGGPWPLVLGGEHTVTVGAVRAAAKRHGAITVLQIDAHGDLRSRWDDTEYSHACVMRRLREGGLPTVAVGIRSICREEAEYIEAERPPIFWAREIVGKQGWIERVVAALGEKVWLTIDLDGLDPSVLPGTGTPEPGGLSWYEACALLRAVIEGRRIVGADVVELAPMAGSSVSEVAAAKLICKVLAYRRAAIERG